MDLDVAVVGAGLMGAATAYALRKRGGAVALFEARAPGHRAGSSHGSARIFRRVYPDPLYVELSGRARELWRELESAAGTTLITLTGGLDHGPGRDPVRLAELLHTAGVPAELLDPEAAGARWPGVVFDGPVLFQPDSGVLDPDRAVATMVRDLTWYPNTPVRRITPEDDGVVLHLDDRVVRAGTAVVAVGAWLPQLLDGVVNLPRLTVTEQTVFHFSRRDPAGSWPTVIHGDGTHTMYALPAGRDGGPGGAMKVGAHFVGPEVTADSRTGAIDDDIRQLVVGYVKDRLPGLEPVPHHETTCLYTSTDDEDFILDRVGPLVVCSPCSGHGAKFAPLIGELAADLCAGRTDRVPDRFRLASVHRG